MGSVVQIAVDQIETSGPEADIYTRLLALDNKHILKLASGSAVTTGEIGDRGVNF